MKQKQDDKMEKIYKRLLKLEEENEVLKNKVNKMEKTSEYPILTQNINSNNNTINNINNGIINNFTLYAHGHEDLSKIDKNELLKGIKQGFNSTTKLTELINFNPKYPEYHNIYISNMKSKYAMKYDGKEWTLVRKYDLIDNLYEHKRDYIHINMDEYSKSLSKVQRESIDRWMLLDEINPDDPIIRRIKSDIELLLYNSRGIPINTMESNGEQLPIDDYEQKINNKTIKKKTKVTKTVKDSTDSDDELISICKNKNIKKRPNVKNVK